MKYPGSKWGMAKWVISHFPEHHRMNFEPPGRQMELGDYR